MVNVAYSSDITNTLDLRQLSEYTTNPDNDPTLQYCHNSFNEYILTVVYFSYIQVCVSSGGSYALLENFNNMI